MTTDLIVAPERHADRLTLNLTGETDIGNCSRVDEALDLDGCTSVVLDLAGLTFMDSSGVSLVLRLRHRFGPEGVRLALHGVQGQPRRRPRRPGRGRGGRVAGPGRSRRGALSRLPRPAPTTFTRSAYAKVPPDGRSRIVWRGFRHV